MTDSANISVVILTFNEELNVRNALESVRWCDNVVVVDSFSTDRTEDICREFSNVTFLQHDFENFAAQRQYGLESGYVRHDWVLALDADERVPAELRDELMAIATADDPDGPVAYDIAMRIHMWGKWLKYSSEYPVYWRRFLRPEQCRFIQQGHADKVDTDGPIGRTNCDLIHDDAKGLDDWLTKHNRYTTMEAAYAAGELKHVPFSDILATDRAHRRRALKRVFRLLPFNATLRFIHLYIVRLGFLDGRRGLYFCLLRAQQHFIVKLKMFELSRLTEQSLENDSLVTAVTESVGSTG